MQRGEQQPGDDDDKSPEADNYTINLPFEIRLDRSEISAHRSDIRLGSDVLVDRIVNLGCDPLGCCAVEAGTFKSAGQA